MKRSVTAAASVALAAAFLPAGIATADTSADDCTTVASTMREYRADLAASKDIAPDRNYRIDIEGSGSVALPRSSSLWVIDSPKRMSVVVDEVQNIEHKYISGKDVLHQVYFDDTLYVKDYAKGHTWLDNSPAYGVERRSEAARLATIIGDEVGMKRGAASRAVLAQAATVTRTMCGETQEYRITMRASKKVPFDMNGKDVKRGARAVITVEFNQDGLIVAESRKVRVGQRVVAHENATLTVGGQDPTPSPYHSTDIFN